MKIIVSIVAAALAFGAPAIAQEALMEHDLLSIDLDGDGKVSEAEYLAYADRAFAQLDKSKTGSLTAAESKVILTPEHIALTDTDKNGLISRAEYDLRMKADFQAADRDGNGFLD